MIRWPGADSDLLWCGSGNVGLHRGDVMGMDAGILPRRGWSLCGGISRFLGARLDSQLLALGRMAAAGGYAPAMNTLGGMYDEG